jgi:hypothetical protein
VVKVFAVSPVSNDMRFWSSQSRAHIELHNELCGVKFAVVLKCMGIMVMCRGERGNRIKKCSNCTKSLAARWSLFSLV